MFGDTWVPSDSSDGSDPDYGGGAFLREGSRYVPIRPKPPATADPVDEIILPSIEVKFSPESHSSISLMGSMSSLSSCAKSPDLGE